MAAYSQYHLERTLRSLRMVEQDAPAPHVPAAPHADEAAASADPRAGAGADA